MAATIQLRRGTAAQWTAANPVLAAGEPAFESDTGKFKIGTGSTAWNSLSYVTGGTVSLTSLDIAGASDIGAAIADTDAIGLYDISATANRKTDASRIPTYVFSKVSGDVTVNSSGVAAIGSGVVVNADVSASAAIAHSKLANATAGQVLLGTTTTGVVTATTVSGDVTITGAGVTAIGAGVIVDADVNASAAIAATKISGTAVVRSDYTAKGVLLSASGASTPVALTVGTNGFVLMADSTQTSGLKWAEMAAGADVLQVQVFS